MERAHFSGGKPGRLATGPLSSAPPDGGESEKRSSTPASGTSDFSECCAQGMTGRPGVWGSPGRRGFEGCTGRPGCPGNRGVTPLVWTSVLGQAPS
jgi:hypothetical protein